MKENKNEKLLLVHVVTTLPQNSEDEEGIRELIKEEMTEFVCEGNQIIEVIPSVAISFDYDQDEIEDLIDKPVAEFSNKKADILIGIFQNRRARYTDEIDEIYYDFDDHREDERDDWFEDDEDGTCVDISGLSPYDDITVAIGIKNGNSLIVEEVSIREMLDDAIISLPEIVEKAIKYSILNNKEICKRFSEIENEL